MAEEAERSEWDRTALLAAVIHNSQVSERHKQKSPAKFNPWPPRLTKEKAARNVGPLVAALIPNAKYRLK